jgi:hypothetical protein
MREDFEEGRLRRTVNDLVMAEMFLIQATIESAGIIGDGMSELGRHVAGEEGDDTTVPHLLQRIADEALEPYTSRFRYLRALRDSDD